MTDNNHPITPPPDLVREWTIASPLQRSDEYWAYELYIAHHAARWGADQELEACCEWLKGTAHIGIDFELLHARRPKPPSLKEQALALISHDSESQPFLSEEGIATIRRALESLPD